MKRTTRQKTLPAARAARMLRKKVSQTKVAYDVATASTETIGHRTAMMGRAMTDPSVLSNPEFATMGREKLVVGGEAAMAMMRQAVGVHRVWSDYWFQQMQRSFAAVPQLAGSTTPTRLMQVATGSIGTSIADLMTFWMKATNFSQAIVDAGAKPIHRAVVGNSKRLARAA